MLESDYTSLVIVYTIAVGLALVSLLIGIFNIFYGRKSFIWPPFAILPFCGLTMFLCHHKYFTNFIILLILTSSYGILIWSLQFTKNGKSAMSLMKSGYPNNNAVWNEFVSYFVYASIAINVLALFIPIFGGGLYHNGGIEFAVILIELLICLIFIMRKLKLGVYLIPIVLLENGLLDLLFAKGGLSIVIGIPVLFLYIIGLLILHRTKKNGKSAWSVMK